MADVSDVDANLPKLAFLTNAQRIVEVLGILRVDGAGEDVAEVLTTGYLLWRDAWLYLLGSLLDVMGILIRQTILCQDGVHLYVVVALLAQHVDDFTDNVLRFLRRPLRNLDDSLVARLAALQLLLRNEDIVYKDVTLGNQEGIVFLHLQLTDCLVALVTQNLDDHRFLDMLLAASHIGHLHTVAIHSKQRVALTDEHGCAAIVGLERVLAVGLADEGSLLHLRLQVQTIRVITDFRQEVVPRHLFHEVNSQHLRRMCIQLQCLEDLLKRESLIRILLKQCLQHLCNLLLIQPFSTFFLTHSIYI